jgi:hypothetical protein
MMDTIRRSSRARARSVIAAPQLWQNRAAGGFSCPHAGQLRISSPGALEIIVAVRLSLGAHALCDDTRRVGVPSCVMAGSRYGVVFCGGGPAATGVVVAAATDGRLAELLSHGICVLEQGEVIGPGALGHYPISANTRGITFLRSLETAPPPSVLAPVLTDPATQALARLRHLFPHLPLVGRHLESMGRAVRAAVQSQPGCAVVTRHTVREVRLRTGGGVVVSAQPVGGGPSVTVTADHAVIAMGARPRSGLDELTLLPGVDLVPYSDKVCHAAALLDDRIELSARLRRAIADAGEVVVVGGSHSAWSSAWMLLHDAGLRTSDGRPPTVTVLHRSAIRFFFWTTTQARAAGYPFDEATDVCPQTGMVHRHGGLRADAHALAWSATRDGQHDGPVRAIALLDEPRPRAAAERALERAGAIIAAVGYVPALPSLRWPDGRPLQLASDVHGARVTERAQLIAADGTVLPQLLALGLGAGLPAAGELAGEPAYTGRLDAVRLYQADVGRIVVDSLLGAAQS